MLKEMSDGVEEVSESKPKTPEGIEWKLEREKVEVDDKKAPKPGNLRTGVEGDLETPVTTGMHPMMLKKPPMLTSSQGARADSQ